MGSILLVELTVGAAYAAVTCTIGSESLDCMLLLYLKVELAFKDNNECLYTQSEQD